MTFFRWQWHLIQSCRPQNRQPRQPHFNLKENFQQISFKGMKVSQSYFLKVSLVVFHYQFCQIIIGLLSVGEDSMRPSVIDTGLVNDDSVIQEVEEEVEDHDSMVYDIVRYLSGFSNSHSAHCEYMSIFRCSRVASFTLLNRTTNWPQLWRTPRPDRGFQVDWLFWNLWLNGAAFVPLWPQN